MSVQTRALLLAAALMIVVTIGAPTVKTDHGLVSREPLWAEAAESYFHGMTESFCCEADFGSAAYFLASGSLDLRMAGGSIAATAEEMAAALDFLLTGPERTRAQVVLDDLYLSASGAIASYRLIYSGQQIVASAALYTVEDAQLAGRLYSDEYSTGSTPTAVPLDERTAMADRYFTAWSHPDPDTIAVIYASNAVVVDSLSGRIWSGHEDILAGIDHEAAGTIQPGPSPNLMSFHLDGRSELLVFVQTTGPCPMREARRWILQDALIIEDIRYRHVPSARRCGLDLHDGWWIDFEPPDPARGVSNQKIAVNGGVVEVINAEQEQLAFTRWVFDRYQIGLDSPHVTGVWFPPSVDCSSDGSFARRQDERFGGSSSVTFCLNDDRFIAARSATQWQPETARLGLHELAHVWMYDHVSVAQQKEFVQRSGVADWRTDTWGHSGVEQAAETIAWGLSGNDYDTYALVPRPPCAELAGRYELLTHRPPLTTCRGSDAG